MMTTGAATCLTSSFMDSRRQSVPHFDRFAAVTPWQWPLSSRRLFTLFPATCGASKPKIAPDARLGQRFTAHSGGGEGRNVFGNRGGRVYRVEHSGQPQ